MISSCKVGEQLLDVFSPQDPLSQFKLHTTSCTSKGLDALPPGHRRVRPPLISRRGKTARPGLLHPLGFGAAGASPPGRASFTDVVPSLSRRPRLLSCAAIRSLPPRWMICRIAEGTTLLETCGSEKYFAIVQSARLATLCASAIAKSRRHDISRRVTASGVELVKFKIPPRAWPRS